MILKIFFGVFLISFVNTSHRFSNFKLIVLHNNDMHGRFDQTGKLSDVCRKNDAENNSCFGGFARIAHVVREYRRRAKDGKIPSVLYLNAGDTYTGTIWFALYKENISAEFMNILQPDAMVRLLINHLSVEIKFTLR
jgi:2',3'-cyclic-nucleotide 2'-phosphodiesterase (5'-nucleotidase family)